MKVRCAEDRYYLSFATFAVLGATQLSDALSFPSLLPPRRTDSRATKLFPRQSNASIPEAISIAPSQYWEGNDGPWSTFPLQVGTGAVGGLQNVRVLVSTAVYAIWTVGAEGCPNNFVTDCSKNRGGLFLTNQSLTWTPNSIYETGVEINLGLETNGYLGYDTATLGWQGSGGPSDEHSIIWNVASSTYWLGVFGLNPRPTNLTTFSDPQTSFMQTLVDNNKIPSLAWGYTAGNQYRLDRVYGSLTLGGYDSNRFTPNNISFDFYPDISRDLSVNLHSITTSKGPLSNLLPDGSISIFIDSTVPEIWLPESACAAFENAFGINYDNDYNRYLITSSQRQKLLTQNAEITFTIGPAVTGGETVDIVLPYQAFDLQVQFPIVSNPNSSYYFPLQRAANDTEYTLGRTFLQEAYVIADYERQNFSVSQCAWDQEKVITQNIVSIASSNNGTTDGANSNSDQPVLTTAAVAGVAVGVAGVIGLLGLTLFLLRRRKNAEKRRLAALEEKNSSSASSQHGNDFAISNPMGGELGGGEIHEMPIQGHAKPLELDGPHAQPNQVGYSEIAAHHEHYDPGNGFATEMPADNVAVYEMPTRRSRPRRQGWSWERRSKEDGGWI